MAKVYLDPGHGGYDSGACGCGKRECDLALQIALKVRDKLTAAGMQVRMSRTSNNVPCNCDHDELPRRPREANAWGADIYVSIHLNAGGGHGIETLHSVVGGKSTVLAQDIQTAVLAACPGYTDRGLKTQLSSDGVHDRVCVIRESAMPAALVECGFVDSADDMSHWNADKFAQGITAGICKYFGVITNISATPQAQAAASSGGRSAIICTAQQFYNARGAGLKTDGYWGPATRKAATASVQRGCNQAYGAGLTVDGIWGPKTAAAVHTLRHGSNNESVLSLQAALLAHGYSVGSAGIDGKFGAGTEAAVRTYQRAAGLTVDGLAGRATFAALCK